MGEHQMGTENINFRRCHYLFFLFIGSRRS